MGPSYPEVLRRLVGQPRPKPGEKFWHSEGMISPPDPSTVETPEERFARDYAGRSMSRRSVGRIMSEYRRQYEMDLRGGASPDYELGKGMTSVQFE